MQVFRSAAFLAATFVLGMTSAPAAQTKTITLKPMYGSDVHGTAVLTQRGRDLVINIVLTGVKPGSPPNLAHIDPGTCGNFTRGTSYSLEPVVNGYSTSTLRNIDIATFAKRPYSVTIHKPLAHISLHVECGGPISAR